ncbi:hypothetical protein [Paenibacillus sp. y28]
MPKHKYPKFKQSDGNKYAFNNEFAKEVIARNTKHPAQNNPSEGVQRGD